MLGTIVILACPPLAMGLAVYFHSRGIEDDKRRKKFFRIWNIVYLLIFAAGAAIVSYARTLMGWDVLTFHLVGIWVAITGAGSAAVTAVANAFGNS